MYVFNKFYFFNISVFFFFFFFFFVVFFFFFFFFTILLWNVNNLKSVKNSKIQFLMEICQKKKKKKKKILSTLVIAYVRPIFGRKINFAANISKQSAETEMVPD